jgi:SAM-dependent methyltransferase
MNPNRALWEKGDFTQIAAFMRESGEEVVKSIGIRPPLRALDLGCGDGTTAMPLALLGAEVTGIDIARNLVEAGNRRAAEAGLGRLKFYEGDACNLEGVRDHSFDLTLSVFGAMFAPKPFDVAREMVRVTKPGGRIVMGNWIPNDPSFVSQVLKTGPSYCPLPGRGGPVAGLLPQNQVLWPIYSFPGLLGATAQKAEFVVLTELAGRNVGIAAERVVGVHQNFTPAEARGSFKANGMTAPALFLDLERMFS